MTEPTIPGILRASKTVAIVGLSRSSWKDSHDVARYLQGHGYRIIPINPFAQQLLGERCYKSLRDLPPDIAKQVDIVNVFRPSHDVPAIVDEAIELRRRYGKPDAVWLQLGIRHDDALRQAETVGIHMVQDRCIKIEHVRYAS